MRRLKVLNPKSLAALRKGGGGGSSGKRGGASSSSSASTSSLSSSSLSSGDFSSLETYADAGAASAASSGETAGENEEDTIVADTPALDLGFLLEEIMSATGAAPLRWDAVVSSDVPLKVIASCVDSLSPVVLGDFDGAADLANCLRASATVPEVAGEPVFHRGRRLVDAAVFEPVPFRAAINDGATHVLALCTRPPPSGAVARLVGGKEKERLRAERAVSGSEQRSEEVDSFLLRSEEALFSYFLSSGAAAERKKSTLFSFFLTSFLPSYFPPKKHSKGVVERVVKKAVMSPEYMKPVWRREVELVASFGLADFEMLQLGLERRGAAARSRPEFGGALLYPVFPGPAAQYAPVCTDVPTIRAGIAEGRAVVERLFGPEAVREAEEQRRREEEEGAEEATPLSSPPSPSAA